ncbi:venom protease-like isoform X3 [Belonocnema kinseyi]|uniref:venom protease-like isoform X3 n=1 Tax=Belonocnema kinseyi TaxID=2817044 RepID=UPI00143E07DB|nr:venom protease-like isoform X3 [Belonocnema kinseyi]
MYLLIIVLTICSPFVTYAQFDLLEGETCVAKTFTGRCRLSRNCPSVFQNFNANKPPEKICSFPNSDDIIICCPDDNFSSSVTSSTTQRINTTPTRRVNSGVVPLNTEARKRPAAEKCEEYSKHVYALEIPPILTVDRQPVNISLCAITSKKLIVGGTLADPKEFPHMAALGFDNGPAGIKWQCGGSLVSEKFVLTAAHCTYSRDWGEPKWVRIGDLNLIKNNDDAQPVNRRIAEIIIHPQYRKPSEYHDIALLRMDKTVKFDAYVRPACLPIFPDIPFRKVIATGWGLTDIDEENGSDDLLKVTLATVPTEICQASYKRDRTTFDRGIVSRWQICAGEVNKDTCQVIFAEQIHFRAPV